MNAIILLVLAVAAYYGIDYFLSKVTNGLTRIRVVLITAAVVLLLSYILKTAGLL